jgi:uncharacterized protein YdeI (YjbR/CyaY-like superfamily)
MKNSMFVAANLNNCSMILRKWESYQSFYIEHNQNAAQKLWDAGERRVLIEFADGSQVHYALLRMKELGYISRISAALIKKQKLQVDKTIPATMQKDDSEFQFAMPEEFAEVLAQDEAAFAVFDKLTDGNKRSLIQLVAMVKSSEKRIDRAIFVAEKLKMGITRGRDMMMND